MVKLLRLTVFGVLLYLFCASASARVQFGTSEFPVASFRDIDKLEEACSAPAASSFFCSQLDATLTLITTKGVDVLFNERGELVAAYAKQQKGQDLRGNYSVESGQNLIPSSAPVPGGALLLDGEYVSPTDVESSWVQEDETTLLGSFRFRVGAFTVEKSIRVSNVAHTIRIELEMRPGDQAAGGTAGQAEPLLVQYAFPGLGRNAEPAVKIGQGTTFSLNPLPQPVADPAYVSLQSNNRNTGSALVVRPDESARTDLAAVALSRTLIAIQKPLPTGDASTEIALEVYLGPNELVRFNQEGYDQLPGLFRPNLLGRLSLGIIWFLQLIHQFIGSWGLSIIVLTLVFRALIWPLIATQTRSMFGMQELQPKIQALQKKYKDDREKLTQETMKLYREAGVNPAGGCLPILLQMPLFIILWRVFVNFEFNQGFLWIPDLGQPDPIYIMPVLYVGVMLAQSVFSARGNRQSLQQQIIINLVFVFIILSFPAGVILYFVVSMGIQVFQYWLLSRNKPAPAPAKAK